MQALKKRKIKPGYKYDRLFPKSRGVDTVVQPEGKAKLHHTINLIKEVVATTLKDTEKVAPTLKASTLRETCCNVWQFVYDHFQYQLDKKGVEQVRRPSRMWKDRLGDCDCMTVMICSILTNLNIGHKVRITKYAKNNPWLLPRYQHIYPIVPTGNGKYITMDCVTDWFDYEVPYLEKKDFTMNDGVLVGTIEGIPSGFSGVDSLALREVIGAKLKHQKAKERNRPAYRIRPISPAVNINILVGQNKPHQPKQVVPKTPSPLKEMQQLPSSAPQTMTTSRSILPEDTPQVNTTSPTLIQSRPNTTVKKGGVLKKILIAGAVGIGTYQLIKMLT
ncbi:hypothetical protein C900_02350 [Fulvivirga imtechensis AK7]|uniref:Transglutaminase-like domain-containing protein n=1 Tax=Fulvivirga imtechensis AK7 TaxID=1237149 RepID=L8JSF5_9BACT|nr:hypothetical protein [Fulvivirga imtechensis]ELR71765.1 hypothetical protein C900_02350 [Fulvivirga imtechensis AK7]